MGCWPQRRVAAVLVHTAAAAHIAAAVLYIIRYREMKARFTTPKSGSCDRKGEGCGRKPVGLLRRRVGMEAQRGCLTPGMSAVFTPPPWGFRMANAPYNGQNGRCLVPHRHCFSVFCYLFSVCSCPDFQCPSGCFVELCRLFLACSSMDCCVQIYGFVTLCPNKFG